TRPVAQALAAADGGEEAVDRAPANGQAAAHAADRGAVLTGAENPEALQVDRHKVGLYHQAVTGPRLQVLHELVRAGLCDHHAAADLGCSGRLRHHAGPTEHEEEGNNREAEPRCSGSHRVSFRVEDRAKPSGGLRAAAREGSSVVPADDCSRLWGAATADLPITRAAGELALSGACQPACQPVRDARTAGSAGTIGVRLFLSSVPRRLRADYGPASDRSDPR